MPRSAKGLVFAFSLGALVFSAARGGEVRVSSASQITAAMATARPGDTLTMTNGTWTNALIAFAGYGTASAPIVLRAESYGGVILTGTSNLRISGRHLVVDGLLFENGRSPSGAVVEFRGTNGESDSCRLTNTVIREYNPPDSSVDYKWISLYGTRNRVDHCYLRGKKHLGTTLVVWVSSKPNYHQIDHNYFAFRPPYPVNGAETIRVGTSDVSMNDSFTMVEYNYFEGCNGESEIISSKSCGNVYRYNTFVSCQGALTLRHGNRNTVEGNFFFGNSVASTGGIRIIGEDHIVINNYICGTEGTGYRSALTIMDGFLGSPLSGYLQVKRAVVAFNTFVDNRSTFNLGLKGSGDSLPPLPPDSCLIANNAVYTTHAPIVTLSDTPTNLTWKGNMMHGASLGITQPGGITLVNPQLALGGDGLWRPGTSSPVIDSSAGSFPLITTDLDGQPRDGSPDVGADERSAAAVTRRPLTPADVGPPPSMLTGVGPRETDGEALPRGYALEQNYPNPFNPSTSVSYRLPVRSMVTLRIYNMLGQVVAELVNGEQNAGLRSVVWNATVSGGVYFCRLEAVDVTDRNNRFVSTRKMVLLR